MTSYLKYMRDIKVVKDDDDNIESWITVKGNHIPIKKGQSKEEAVKSFIEKKGDNASSGEQKSNNNGTFKIMNGAGKTLYSAGTQAEAEKWAKENVNKAHSSLKVISGNKKYKEYEPKTYKKEYDPDFETVRKNALANSSVYGGKYTQKSKAEAYKEYKNDTASKENMKKASKFVNSSGSGTPRFPSEKQMMNGMIESILAYGGMYSTPEEIVDTEYHGKYLKDYVKKFGREKVIKAIKNMRDKIDHIEPNVYTDSEGGSYNSIVWKKKNTESKKEPDVKTSGSGTPSKDPNDILNLFGQKYSALYKGDIKRDSSLVKEFDKRLKEDEAFRNGVKDFVMKRGDILSSDREAEAYMLALKESEKKFGRSDAEAIKAWEDIEKADTRPESLKKLDLEYYKAKKLGDVEKSLKKWKQYKREEEKWKKSQEQKKNPDTKGSASASEKPKQPKDIMDWKFEDVMKLPASDPRVHKYIAKNNGLRTETVATISEAFPNAEDLYFEINRMSERKGYGWDTPPKTTRVDKKAWNSPASDPWRSLYDCADTKKKWSADWKKKK